MIKYTDDARWWVQNSNKMPRGSLSTFALVLPFQPKGVGWPTTSCSTDSSKCSQVTFIAIERRTSHKHHGEVMKMIHHSSIIIAIMNSHLSLLPTLVVAKPCVGDQCSCVCVWLCSKRKTTYVLNTKLGTHILNGRTSACIDPEVKSQITHTHTHNRLTALLEYVWDHPGEQVPER